jgi:hypothetical protein
MGFVSTQEKTVIATPISGDYRVDVLLDGAGFRWNAPNPLKSPVTITYSFAESVNYFTGKDANGFLRFTEPERKATREILALISSQFNITFSEITETASAGTSFGQLRFANNAQGTSSGYAYFPPENGVGESFNGDNFINNAEKYLTDYSILSTQGGYNYSLIIHEILHSLGIKHPGNYNAGEPPSAVPGNYLISSEDNSNNSVMSYVDNVQGLQRIDLGLYDMLAMTYLYGAKSYRAETNQYFFSDSAANNSAASSAAGLKNTAVLMPDTGRFLQLVNDTGGANTFNFKSMTAGVKVNLGQGASTSAGFLADGRTAAIDNIQIAFGTEINSVIGSNFNDTIIGNTGANLIEGGPGNDTIDGGGGVDTVVYNGPKANYLLFPLPRAFDVSSNSEGTDQLTNCERLKFTDCTVALDLGANQSAGQAALLLGAVLPGKLAIDSSKQALLGSVVGLFDAGFSMPVLSGALLRLDIWSILTGQNIKPTSRTLAEDTVIVKYLLSNVYGLAADDATVKANAEVMNGESFQGAWLAQLALSNAGQSHIGLVGLASTGLIFT